MTLADWVLLVGTVAAIVWYGWSLSQSRYNKKR